MRRAVPLVVAFLLSCDATVPTPAGTTLVSSPSPSPSAEARTYRVEGALVGRAALQVVFDEGPPRTFRIVVADNERWAMSARCDAPSAPRAAVGCVVTMTRKNGRLAYRVRIEVHASGQVDASALSSDVAVVRE